MPKQTGITGDNNKIVTVTTDGSKERLDVDVNKTGGVKLQQYTPMFDYNTDGDALDGTVTLKSVTASGAIDFIHIQGSTSNYEFILEVDGVEVLRISLSDMSTLGLTFSNSTAIPLYTTVANKNFTLHPNVGMDFKTSFAVKLADTGAPKPNINWMIKWRENS